MFSRNVSMSDFAYTIFNFKLIAEPLDKSMNWVDRSKIRLFAHNHMTREALALDPHDVMPGTGVGGRMLDSKFQFSDK